MFDTLVESGSHSDDLARKGSFFLGTMVLYLIVLMAVAVIGIYWYNDSIPDPSLELLTLVAPAPMEQQEEQVKPKEEPKPTTKQEQAVVTRTEISVNAPVVKSNEVAKETTKEVARDMSKFINKGNEDSGLSTSAPRRDVGFAEGTAREGSGAAGPAVAGGDDAPPPPPAAKPEPKPEPKKTIVSGGVLNGKAISKPPPAYPPIAKAARAAGTVTVQIVVDESGRVISASAVSGHPLLQQAAVAAARQARFSPTLLSGQPVKVSGVITYNFVLQ
jgi:periplasmic protein TonB